jgi:2,5-diamino-6-(ribosylamino)-4(3H)-pyrimidinone 5'-phosphate reductase
MTDSARRTRGHAECCVTRASIIIQGAQIMRPHVTCHMMSSVDGRIKQHNWGLRNAGKLFETTAAKIKVDAWLVGRKTMEEFSSHEPRRKRRGSFRIPRVDFVADYRNDTFAVAIDPHGKCHWDANTVDTEHVIEVLTESVSGEYLDHLRSVNVSYIFGGKRSLDLARVLDKLRSLFDIKRVRIDGGGHVNGSFLNAGLIDEFSHILVPVVDGTIGTPAVFDVETGYTGRMATHMTIQSIRRIERNALWIRYKVLKPRR